MLMFNMPCCYNLIADMYINFQQIGLVDQSKPCTQNFLANNHKLHKFVTTCTNSN